MITDARVFRERTQYMKNVRHAQALMDESDRLELDIEKCQDQLWQCIADQNLSELNANSLAAEIERLIVQNAECDSKTKFYKQQLQVISQPKDDARSKKQSVMVEEKTLFTSLLRPKTADTVRSASA